MRAAGSSSTRGPRGPVCGHRLRARIDAALEPGTLAIAATPWEKVVRRGIGVHIPSWSPATARSPGIRPSSDPGSRWSRNDQATNTSRRRPARGARPHGDDDRWHEPPRHPRVGARRDGGRLARRPAHDAGSAKVDRAAVPEDVLRRSTVGQHARSSRTRSVPLLRLRHVRGRVSAPADPAARLTESKQTTSPCGGEMHVRAHGRGPTGTETGSRWKFG